MNEEEDEGSSLKLTHSADMDMKCYRLHLLILSIWEQVPRHLILSWTV